MEKITLEHVSYTYSPNTPYEVKALDDVSVGIEAGSITGIIGHTGSGKSTFVQLLNGLERAPSGRVLLDGADIWEKPREIGRIRFRVGLVMQYPEYQLFEESIRADIGFGPKNMGLSEDEIAQRVSEAARFVELDETLLDKSPFELSGGQKRRAAIAGIIAMRPEVLVLDEPAAGLDPRGRDAIFESIKRYRDETGATIVVVSHSMEDMARFCDEIIVMSHGSVVMKGSCGEVFSHAKELEEVGLSIPEITRLMLKLRARGVGDFEGIYTVADAAAALAPILRGEGKA